MQTQTVLSNNPAQADGPIELTFTPGAYPHVLASNCPLGLREDHKEEYLALVRGVAQREVGAAEVEAWLLRAARDQALVRLSMPLEGPRFAFPLLLVTRGTRHRHVWPAELASLRAGTRSSV